MTKILSIAAILLHLSFSLGAMASSIWMEGQSDQFLLQNGAYPEDWGGQESQDLKDMTNEYCPKSSLYMSELHLAKRPSQYFFEGTTPWVVQNEGEIQTPPPDQC